MPKNPVLDSSRIPTRVVAIPDSARPAADAPSDPSTTLLRYTGGPAKPLFPDVGDSLLHYRLVGELGSGAFSRVFLATQQDLAGRLVALKVSEAADSEPQRLARLQHANIVPIYSVHHHFQYQVVCMPYVGAHTLATLLHHHKSQLPVSGRAIVETIRTGCVAGAETKRDDHESGSTPAPAAPLAPNLELLNRLSHVEAVLWIVARLADGLDHAHSRGILHSDLKPQNVLIADDGQPMLLDFNVALDSRSRGKQQFGGTVPYMAPEHLLALDRGEADIDARADLYSLGIILYQMLTGRDPHGVAPIESAASVAIVRKSRLERPQPPSRWNKCVTPDVDSIVLKLLEPGAAQRYATAADLRDDLERHLADRPLAHAPNRSFVERGRKWRRRNPRLAMALAALVLLVLPATALAVRQEKIARRRLELQQAEALLHRQSSLDQVRAAQVMLSTQIGDRSLIEHGLALGREVLAEYGVGNEVAWTNGPLFSSLPSERQGELRREFGELLLLMARGEMLRGTPGDQDAARAALAWNQLAEACLTSEARPKWLTRQRAELLAILPGAAEPLPDAAGSELDAFHEGLEEMLRGRHAAALAKLVPFAERHPAHFMASYARGVSHEAVNQWSDAAAAFSACAALRPEMPWPFFSRGLVRLRQNRFVDADADFGEALRLKPDWTAALINRAIAREGRKDFTGAEHDLTAALARPDAPTRALFLRSQVRRAAGDAKGAERDAADALKLTPADAVSWITRGVWRLDRNAAAAIADFDEALKLDPRSRDGLQNKAVVLADNLKQPKEAAAVMSRLLELYPDHVEARAARGVYLARCGEAEQARRDAADCLRDEPTAFRCFQMAGLHAQLARTDATARREALRLLALALRTGFDNLALLGGDPDLDPIRDSAEFRALAAHARGLQPRP